MENSTIATRYRFTHLYFWTNQAKIDCSDFQVMSNYLNQFTNCSLWIFAINIGCGNYLTVLPCLAGICRAFDFKQILSKDFHSCQETVEAIQRIMCTMILNLIINLFSCLYYLGGISVNSDTDDSESGTTPSRPDLK